MTRDTLREQVMLVVFDTIKEVTTTTIVLRQASPSTGSGPVADAPERSPSLSKGQSPSLSTGQSLSLSKGQSPSTASTSSVTGSATVSDDTIKVTTVTDRIRASTRDRYHDVKEKLLINTDTVYVERQADKQTVVTADPNVEIDKEGNVTRKVNRISQTLKWVFFVALAIAVLLLVIKFYKH